jgi:hypothetical protein
MFHDSSGIGYPESRIKVAFVDGERAANLGPARSVYSQAVYRRTEDIRGTFWTIGFVKIYDL